MIQAKAWRVDVWSEDGTNRQGTVLSRDIESASITEEENGAYDLSFAVPYTERFQSLLQARWLVYVYDIIEEKENPGSYVPKKFRIQQVKKEERQNGVVSISVVAEHISFDLLAEVVADEKTYASLNAEELLTKILEDSPSFTKGAASTFLEKFTIDSFSIGARNRLDMLRDLTDRVDGTLVVTDGKVVTIQTKKDPQVDSPEAFVRPRYNLLSLSKEADSRRLVTRMYGIGSGEPRLQLRGTWHPIVAAYQGAINGVAVHKIAPNDDAYEPISIGGVTRKYYLEFRESIGKYWPITRFAARGAPFGGGADLIEIDIIDLGDAVLWTQMKVALSDGDFVRLWYDSTGEYAESDPPPPPAVVPEPGTWDGGQKIYDAYGNGVYNDGTIGIVCPDDLDHYVVGLHDRSFTYWNNAHAETAWATKRNEGLSRVGAAAYHPAYGLMVVGGLTPSLGVTSAKIRNDVDHYTEDANSDETDTKSPGFPNFDTLAGTYKQALLRRGKYLTAIFAYETAEQAPTGDAGIQKREFDTGSGAWGAASDFLWNSDTSENFLPESDASHPGGAGLDPHICDVDAKSEKPTADGGGVHALVRYWYLYSGKYSYHCAYINTGTGFVPIPALDDYWDESNANKSYNAHVIALPEHTNRIDVMDYVRIAVFEVEHLGTNNNTIKLRILKCRITSLLPPEEVAFDTWEDVETWTGVSDADLSGAWGLSGVSATSGQAGKDAGLRGDGVRRARLDYAFDENGNEHIAYTVPVAGYHQAYYRFKDNTAGTPAWSSATLLSSTADWIDSGGDPHKPRAINFGKKDGIITASTRLRVYWVGNISVFDNDLFMASVDLSAILSGSTKAVYFDVSAVLTKPDTVFDCNGNVLPLTQVNWIEVRDRSATPTRGYELHGWVDGIAEDSSLEFTENLISDPFFSRLGVGFWTSGKHPIVNDIGNGTPTFTRNTSLEHTRNGNISQRVQTTNADEGCYIDFDMGLSSRCSKYFSVKLLVKLIAGQIIIDVSEGDAGDWSTRAGQTIFPPLTENPILLTRQGEFTEIQFNGIEERAGSAGRIWIYQDGATGADFYVDSVMVEPLAAGSEDWHETSTQRDLWTKAYDELAKVNGTRNVYALTMRDLFDEGLNPYSEFGPRSIIELKNDEIGVAATRLRVTKKTSDLLEPGNVAVELSETIERHQDQTAASFLKINETVQSAIKSVRKQIKERLRLGPPKFGIVVRDADKTQVDVRTTILDGTSDPYP